jgi:hypothetical protein
MIKFCFSLTKKAAEISAVGQRFIAAKTLQEQPPASGW